MSYVFIQEQDNGERSSGPCNTHRQSLSEVVGAARTAVQIATQQVVAESAGDETIAPVTSRTHVNVPTSTNGEVYAINV